MNTFGWKVDQAMPYLIGAPEPTALPETAAPATSRMPMPSPVLAAARQAAVRTFDVFDTLIARRCVEPVAVFEIVGRRIGMAEFAAARQAAEVRIAHHAHDLDMIYDELARQLMLDPLQAAAIKAIELDVELEQVVPIAENMARIRHGDVLIAHTYLGTTAIRQMLERAGLDKKVGLVVTSDGKSSGAIWPQVIGSLSIEEHLGSHPHSDESLPMSFGIAASQTLSFLSNPVEDVLMSVGLRQLAELCREIRLSTWSGDQQTRGLQIIQASLNFPILLLSSIMLVRLVERLEKRSVLFSSGSCDCWLPLFEEIARRNSVPCASSYFYTSSLMRTQPSSSYLKYAGELLTEDAVVVELCGTGRSFAHLAETLGLDHLPVFLLHQLNSIAPHAEQATVPNACELYSVVPFDTPDVDCSPLQMCNYADYGVVSDVLDIDDFAVPMFAAETRSADAMSMVRAQQACFRAGLKLLPNYDLDDVLALDDLSISTVCTALYQMLSRQSDLADAYGAGQAKEDAAALR